MSDLRDDDGGGDDTPAWMPELTEWDKLLMRKQMKANVRLMMDRKHPGWTRAEVQIGMKDGSQVVIPVYPTEDEAELLALEV